MRKTNPRSWKAKVVLFLSVLMLVAGVGFLRGSAALADSGDGRYVDINGQQYDVMHDGQGPYVEVGGSRYYLDTKNDDKTVMVDGKQYDVMGSRYDSGDHHDRGDHYDHQGDHDSDD